MDNFTLGFDAHEGYQGVLDYEALKAKDGKFIIIKAGEGWRDYRSQDYVKLAKDNGLLTGCYWYYRQTIPNLDNQQIWCEPKRQAQEFWEATRGNFDLPPALDIENANNPYFNSGHILTCLQEIERLFGRKPIIYTGYYIWRDNVGSPAWSTDYDLWLAQYNPTENIYLPPPFTEWKIHQFSDTTEVDGKVIDHNYFNGELIDLLAYAGMGEIPDPEPSADYVEITASSFLRFRPEPVYNPHIKTLIVEHGEVLQIAGATIYEPASGITWLPVFTPSKYEGGFIGYVSKRYVKYL